MGLIVNKPAEGLALSDVLDQMTNDSRAAEACMPVHMGGPVETGRGFVLHSDEYRSVMQTLEVTPGFAMTATLDILEDIAAGKGPKKALMALGYAGWGPGQLEREIAQNGWLICDADAALVFDLPDARKRGAALDAMGIDPLGLSSTGGRA